MVHRPLGNSGVRLSPIGFGAFKIGRNEKTKYPSAYPLPSDEQVAQLLTSVLDLGINYIDTAPAYGSSEERIGNAIAQRRSECFVSTKVGEYFEGGASRYDFTAAGVIGSIARSRKRLRMDVLDLVFVHSDGDDQRILNHTDVVAMLQSLKAKGDVRLIGFSAKTVQGAAEALQWADAIMVEYHINNRSCEPVMAEAFSRGIGVVVKKGLASGHLPPREGIEFVLRNAHVTSMVIGGLNAEHIRHNVQIARSIVIDGTS